MQAKAQQFSYNILKNRMILSLNVLINNIIKFLQKEYMQAVSEDLVLLVFWLRLN